VTGSLPNHPHGRVIRILTSCPATETVRTDVLVVGSGAAGIRAALAAAQEGASVLLVSSTPSGEGGSSFRSVSGGWGMQALLGEERTDAALEAFYDDIIRAGLDMADPLLVRILVEESGSCLLDLIAMGLRFRRDAAGRFIQIPGCFSSERRAVIAESMENIRQTFMSALRRAPVETLPGEVLELLVSHGRCWGAWVLHETGTLFRIAAPATILATGGGAGIFPHRLVSGAQVGTGVSLALAAGAEVRNLEFIQFMLVLRNREEMVFLPLPELGESGCLVTEQGLDILDAYIPDPSLRTRALKDRQTHYPFSTRDASYLVDLAVARENAACRPVFRTTAADSPAQPRVLHAAHAFNGGIRIDERAATNLPGLFAAGESAAGPHGADRIGGCMIAATQVFGRRAGRFAARQAREARRVPDRLPDLGLLGRRRLHSHTPQPYRELETEARALFDASLSVIRDGSGLRRCLTRIHEIKQEAGELTWHDPDSLRRLHRLDTCLVTGEAVARAALSRSRSLGSHLRVDQLPALSP